MNTHYATVSFYEDMDIVVALIMTVQKIDFSDGWPNNEWGGKKPKNNNKKDLILPHKIMYYFYFVFYPANLLLYSHSCHISPCSQYILPSGKRIISDQFVRKGQLNDIVSENGWKI